MNELRSEQSSTSTRGTSVRTDQRNGFALIIALGLMGLIVLLLVTLSTFVRLETATVQSNRVMIEARMAALLGLSEAMGNLQRTTGNDQRVTASSSILDTDPSTPTIDGVGNPHWVGVWDSAPPLAVLNGSTDTTLSWYDYDNRSEDRFNEWLVSNNGPALGKISDAGNTIPPEDGVIIVGRDFDESDPL